MIAYSKYNIQQLFDEIMLRLGNHRSAENIDFVTVANYLNQAFEEAMITTLPLKDWAYTTSYTVSHLQTLDVRFISPIRVMLSVDGLPPYTEARRVDVREWFTILNRDLKQRWNQSTYQNPTYMIWGRRLYLHPCSTWDPLDAALGTVSGIMDCYQYPPIAINPTDTLLIPYEYEEFVILLAMQKITSRTIDNDMLEALSVAVQQEKIKVVEQFAKQQHAKKRHLESFVEPASPYIPPQPEAGELPKRLV